MSKSTDTDIHLPSKLYFWFSLYDVSLSPLAWVPSYETSTNSTKLPAFNTQSSLDRTDVKQDIMFNELSY